MVATMIAALADGAVLTASPGIELGRGAIAGGLIVAIAFLSGYAAIRRSGLAACGLLMVGAAAALEFSWLGFYPGMSPEVMVLLQAVFVAAAIIFLSASIGAARYNPLLGGVMFTAALIIGGMGLINFFDRIDLAQPMRWAVYGIGGFAGILAITQALRGDMGARLILPGVALAVAAPLIGPLGIVEGANASLVAHGLFSIGIVAASLVALTEGVTAHMAGASPTAVETFHGFQDVEREAPQRQFEHQRSERDEIVLESQIARVLDYSGVAIWDWSPDGVNQTASLPALLGSQSAGSLTPDALRNLVHKDDAARFESEVLSPIDGPFDVTVKFSDNRQMRVRGARAADEETGVLERLVGFFEFAPATVSSREGVDGSVVRKATEAAIVPAVGAALAGKLITAIDDGDIIAAFQPIVSLDDHKIAGYEALARWRDQKDGADEGPETFVKAAENAGKGAALAETMLDQAASFLAEKLKSEKRKDLFVALNVSWGQISDARFAKMVGEAVKKYQLPKNALVLELTEGDAVSDAALAENVFKSLKAAGAALAFDDFGAGFTCLSNLCKYDFDYLKIDKSFAVNLEDAKDGAKIVEALASLGKELGLKVIVEGIETKAAAKKALDIGCAYGQGFALGKPSETDAAVDKQKILNKLASYTGLAKKDDTDTDKGMSLPDCAEDDEAVETNSADSEPKSRRWKLWRGADLQ